MVSTQRAFKNRFNIVLLGPVRDRKSILLWVTTFTETGSVQKRRTKVCVLWDYLRTSRDALGMPRNLFHVRRENMFFDGISDRFVRRVLHDVLYFFPYKVTIMQELSKRDFNARRNACAALLEHVSQRFLVMRFISTWLGVNKKNMCYWATENPRELPQRLLNSPRATV